MEHRAVDVVITGQVQGVGFRYSCQDRAEQLGVHGWVRNDRGGTVSAHLEGPADAVDGLLAWCRQGPPGARVADVRVSGADVEELDGFQIAG